MAHVRSPVIRYGTAVGAVTAATIINLLCLSVENNGDTPYFALVAAVLVSALVGGVWPGVLATVLAGFSSAFFSLAPQFSIRIKSMDSYERLLVFLTEGVLISLVGHIVRESEARHIPSLSTRYLAMPLSIGTAMLLKVTVFSQIAHELPFTFFYAAVCLSAWIGGVISGVAATAAAAGLARYFFLAPRHSLAIDSAPDAIRLGLFVSEGLLLSLLNGAHLTLLRTAVELNNRVRSYVQAILRNDEDLRALRLTSRDALWEWDLSTGRIVRGQTPMDSLSVTLQGIEDFSSWVQRIHPDDRPDVLARLARALDGGREECGFSYRLMQGKGAYLRVSDHLHIVHDAKWKPVRVIGRSADTSHGI